MGKKITAAQWLNEYLSLIALRQIDESTRQEKARCARVLCAGIADKKLRKIRPVHIAQTVRAVWETGEQSRARRLLVVARDLFAEAVCAGHIDRNPAVFVRPLPYRIRRARLSTLHWRRTQKQLAAESVPWRRQLARLALATGQRRGDLVKMRFADVWDGYLHIVQEKTGERIALPLDLKLRALGVPLGEIIDDCRRYDPPGETLLRSSTGRGLTVSSLTKAFHRAFKRAVRWRRDDHTAPSLAEVRSLAERLYSAQGIDTQTLLGHKHKATTAIYHDDRGLSRQEGRWRRLKIRRRRECGNRPKNLGHHRRSSSNK
jgi:integrase